MSVFVHKHSRVIIQGFTGQQVYPVGNGFYLFEVVPDDSFTGRVFHGRDNNGDIRATRLTLTHLSDSIFRLTGRSIIMLAHRTAVRILPPVIEDIRQRFFYWYLRLPAQGAEPGLG